MSDVSSHVCHMTSERVQLIREDSSNPLNSKTSPEELVIPVILLALQVNTGLIPRLSWGKQAPFSVGTSVRSWLFSEEVAKEQGTRQH